MRIIINFIRKLLYIDRDIFWILINKTWLTLKGPISIYFILKYLTAEDQGLWYTFISLGALSTFAELGFTTIITQFVSHEFAFLKEKKGILQGEKINLDRIVSLIRFSIKFYFVIVPIAIGILVFFGFIYFDKKLDSTYFAWTIYSILGGITLLSSLFQAIYQGLDKVKATQVNILIGSIVMSAFNWLLLAFNFEIWSLVFGNAIGLILMSFLLYFTAPKLWKQIISYKLTQQFKWINEIIHLQWKYAISWASGFLIVSFYVPIIYKLDGAILAGKFGITFSILMAIQGVAFSWLNAKIPKLNIYVSLGKFDMLYLTFRKSSIVGFVLLLLLSILIILSIIALQYFSIFQERFLTVVQTSLLVIYFIETYIIGSQALLVRTFKKEPFYFFSMITAIFISLNTFLCLTFFDLTIALIVQVGITTVVFIPWAFKIYKTHTRNG